MPRPKSPARPRSPSGATTAAGDMKRSRSRRAGQATITIKDVAQAAGVSVTTVSHVLNATRHVAPRTSARVRSVIAELGFRPSAVARALKADRTRSIGMLVTSSTNPFFAEVIRGVEEGCFARGYSLILCNTGDVSERLESYLATLVAKRIDGLAVMTTNLDRRFFHRLGARRPLPVVAIDTLNVPDTTIVNDDSEAGGRLAGRYLVQRGFRRLAVIAGMEDHPRSRERLAGFRAALAEAGLTLDPALVLPSDLTVGGGFAAMGALLDRTRDDPPEAVFCLNDLLAVGGLCALDKRGLSVPDDISIIGYDDIELAAYTVPPLTTVRQPAAEIGHRAAELLIAQIESGAAVDSVALPPVLIERESVGVAARLERRKRA
ncbi:MAG: LacI family DNA-binding transcriptional regulator [Kiloniellales bacterium]|nr:LacI family DNA-binding transcriptional regulator [Kiloniellales bacterium]